MRCRGFGFQAKAGVGELALVLVAGQRVSGCRAVVLFAALRHRVHHLPGASALAVFAHFLSVLPSVRSFVCGHGASADRAPRMPLPQASLVIAGMLGITVFNEIVGFNSISAYFVAAVVVVTGSSSRVST